MTRSPLRFTAPAAVVGVLHGLAAHIAKHLFTAADGETYAIGRFLGVVLMFWGLLAPSAVAVYLLITQKPTLAEWIDFIAAMNLYIPAIVASVIGLITLTNPTEPKPPEQPPKGDEQPLP